MKTINKTLCILLFFTLSSCARHLPVINTPHINSIETEQEPDWLLIGGQKVDNFDRPRRYEYYLKSEVENVIIVGLLINPKTKNEIATSLEGIEQLVNLQRLHLRGVNLDELDYSPLRTLKNLEKITFNYGNMTKIPDLREIASRESITSIEFEDCALTDFDNIEFLPNLRFVETWNDTDFNDLKALNKLQYLETLRISTANSVFRIEEIASLINLKNLLLHGKQIDVKGIENLTSLEKVQFYNGEIRNKYSLSELKNLQWLEIAIHDQNPDIGFIKNMGNLRGLIIYADDGVWEYPVNKKPYQVLDITPIGSLSQLHYLELRGFILKNIKVLDRLNSLDEAYIYTSVLKDESERTIKTLLFRTLDAGH